MKPDVNSVKEQAQKEVAEELAKKAVSALKAKLRQLADAQQIVKNVEREISDLEASIADGSFVTDNGNCVGSIAISLGSLGHPGRISGSNCR